MAGCATLLAACFRDSASHAGARVQADTRNVVTTPKPTADTPESTDGLSRPSGPFHWKLLGTTPDGKAVRVFAQVDHGGCKYPQATVTRPSYGRVEISVSRGAVPCDMETMELVGGGVVTVGLPVKWGAEEVTIGGPGYSGVAPDPLASAAQPQRYPSVVGLRLTVARQILKANGVKDVSVVGRDDADATVRLQFPAAFATSWHRPQSGVRPKPPKLRPATLVVMPVDSEVYPWPNRMTCAQQQRLTADERASLARGLPAVGCPAAKPVR